MFEMKNADGAAVAATALSLYTVAGCVSGLFYRQIYKIIKRFALAVGFGMSSIGIFIVYFGQTAVIMTIGTMMVGFAFSILMPTAFTILGMRTHPAAVAFATSICMALMNLGGFASTFWLYCSFSSIHFQRKMKTLNRKETVYADNKRKSS